MDNSSAGIILWESGAEYIRTALQVSVSCRSIRAGPIVMILLIRSRTCLSRGRDNTAMTTFTSSLWPKAALRLGPLVSPVGEQYS